VLGFFYQPDISDGQSGIQDIVAALEWVKDHIVDFGGDPNQITVMGQSGGGHAIMCMLTMPKTRKLFQRAILQSTPVGIPPFSKAKALEYGNKFLSLLGIKTTPARELIQRLKTETPANLITATAKLAHSTASSGDITPPFMPVFEDISTQEHFIQAAADGAATARVEIIIGTNGQEANAYFKLPSMQKPDPNLVSQRFSSLTGQKDTIDLYRQRHPGGTAVDLLSDLMTDYYFLFPSLSFAEAVSKAGARTWVYQFDWSPPNSPFKACHCIELPFVFGTLSAWNSAPMLIGADSSVVKDLSAAIQHMWLAFVKKGNPELNIPWPQYRSNGRQTMQFTDTIGPVGDSGGLTWRYHARTRG
jgi:para-nitrobenzyl esterase